MPARGRHTESRQRKTRVFGYTNDVRADIIGGKSGDLDELCVDLIDFKDLIIAALVDELNEVVWQISEIAGLIQRHFHQPELRPLLSEETLRTFQNCEFGSLDIDLHKIDLAEVVRLKVRVGCRQITCRPTHDCPCYLGRQGIDY